MEATLKTKLEDFLRANSEQLAPHLQKFFDNSKHADYISLDEKVEGLALVAWERKKFLQTIKKIERSFAV